MTTEHLVLDASAVLDLLVAESLGPAVDARIDGHVLHAPAHLDAEVLSGLGRLHRAGALGAAAVARHLDALAVAPIERHGLTGLLAGAWSRRGQLRLADALYVELASTLAVPLVTTDVRLGRATPIAEVIST
ncbi:MAG: type II toxin-antitoxin system VapC family toxin [Candidatus Dormibacteria bacterium]